MSAIPLVYLVQSPSANKVRPWLSFKIDGVMVSAYEFMTSLRKRERAQSKGLREIVEFDGPIMLDSGGFQHLKGKDVDYSPEDLANFGRKSEAKYLFSLDYPPRSCRQDFDLLSRKNFRNFVRMSKVTEVIPVVHAPPELARKEIRLVRPLRPQYVGVGGLVPSLRGAIKMTLETIDLVHEELPDSRIHLMGFGAPRIGSDYLKKAFSVDYGGWRTAAATSYLLTPNGYRKIGTRNKNGHAARPDKSEQVLIRRICTKLGLPRETLNYDFGARATFNAYVASRVMKARPLNLN
jgi:hypothetical protein